MEKESEYDQENDQERGEEDYSQTEESYNRPEKDFPRKDNDYIRLPVNNEEDQPQKPQRRSLWRHWKMLSRFQRNLITMVFVAMVVTMVYYWGLREQVKLEEQTHELLNPQLHQPLPQRSDLEDLKPMHDWEREREEEEVERLEKERRLVEEAKKMQEEKIEEKTDDLDTKKSNIEKKRLDMKRRMDLKEKQEKEQQEKALRDTARLEARLELRKKEADEMFADEWFEIQRQKQEMKREDERLIREEQERKLWGETTTEEVFTEEPTTTLSPEELEKVCP